MLRKCFRMLLLGVSCSLMGLVYTSCGGGGGGDEAVVNATTTTRIDKEKFLAGQSHIYMQNMPNYVREVLIVCNPTENSTTGNATGTVTFKHASLGDLPYEATYEVSESKDGGLTLKIYFEKYLGSNKFDETDGLGRLFRKTMHVKTPAELTGQDDGGWNGVYVTINFSPDGTAKPDIYACGTGHGDAAATARWYDDNGDKAADDSGWGAPMWAQTCMYGGFFAYQTI